MYQLLISLQPRWCWLVPLISPTSWSLCAPRSLPLLLLLPLLLVLLSAQMVSIWVLNTLSPWQAGQYTLACWPYYSYLLPLVELSPWLTPDDSELPRINPDVCEEAAEAAALAEELGYLSAHGFMQQRCAALEKELQWSLKYAAEQLQEVGDG